jgi:hypothetical protein
MGTDCSADACAAPARTAAPNGAAGGGRCAVLRSRVRLPVADAAARLSAAIDGAGLFLSLARRRHLGTDQPSPAAGGARGGGAGSELVGRGDRQPVGEDDRGRRATRLRRRQEDQGPQTAHPHRHVGAAGGGDRPFRRHQDRDGAVPLLASIRSTVPWLRHVFADGGSPGRRCGRHWAGWATGHWRSSDVRPTRGASTFCRAALVVERTLARLNRNRRLAKDFEKSVASAECWMMIASVKLLTRRIARG